MAYKPLEEFRSEDHDHSSSRVRDIPPGKYFHALTIHPEQLNFTGIVEETSAPQKILLTNTGYAAVAITEVLVVGEFDLVGSAPVQVLAGQTVEIPITFEPTVAGVLTGGVYINTGNASGQEFVKLTGSSPEVIS